METKIHSLGQLPSYLKKKNSTQMTPNKRFEGLKKDFDVKIKQFLKEQVKSEASLGFLY